MSSLSPSGERAGERGSQILPQTPPLPTLSPEGERAIKTTCAYCGVGCGIIATQTGERSATIRGDADHPANRGKLCSKGTHLGETIGLEGRLLHPEVGGVRTDWETALSHVADRFAATIAEHGPESVAFYVSGQLLTEDYYVANKLMKGFIGTANIDTNSRLCMASAVAAHNRAFGEDVVPCSYSDLDEADLIVLVGSNTAWCHPVIWQRIEAARAARGTKLVVIDPRRTETAERADLHLPITPDGDVALFNAALLAMKERGLVDEGFLAESVNVPEGFWKTLLPLPFRGEGRGEGIVRLLDQAFGEADSPLSQPSPLKGRGLFEAFITLLAAHPRTVTLFSQGANQSVSGTDKGNAIINLHLATGRIGKPGAGPFSITGQPNAMGGREVGGLASTLACHRGFSAEERDWAQRFWQSPTICPGPGLKAVEMFDAVADGRIKAIWIMATNPAVSMPDAGDVRAALANCPLVVVSDCIAETDTNAFAHVKLPALGWGEKDGTVTNSERFISRQRGFFAAPGDAKPDWWIIAEVAKRLGWSEAFDYRHQSEIFAEFAAMTRFEDKGERVLSLPRHCEERSDAAIQTGHAAGLPRSARNDEWAWYNTLQPFQWGGVSPFADGRFPTSSGKANLVAITPSERATNPEFPFRLNTGRYRDQWHTMTRTGLSPKLSQHRREPLLEVHPQDADAQGLSDGGLARVETPSGATTYRVLVTDAQRRGELYVPMHWTDQMSSAGRTGLLPGKERDPFSGQPGFKNTAAGVAPITPDWAGFLVTTQEPLEADLLYRTKVKTASGWLVELAGMGDTAPALAMLPHGLRSEVQDVRRGTVRAAVIDEGRLTAALFIAKEAALLPARNWLIAQLSDTDGSPVELLAGRPATPAPDRGPILCVCFDVGMNTIIDAIAHQSLTSVEDVGAALSAGTNCGSCRPAIAKLLMPVKEAVNG